MISEGKARITQILENIVIGINLETKKLRCWNRSNFDGQELKLDTLIEYKTYWTEERTCCSDVTVIK